MQWRTGCGQEWAASLHCVSVRFKGSKQLSYVQNYPIKVYRVFIAYQIVTDLFSDFFEVSRCFTLFSVAMLSLKGDYKFIWYIFIYLLILYIVVDRKRHKVWHIIEQTLDSSPAPWKSPDLWNYILSKKELIYFTLAEVENQYLYFYPDDSKVHPGVRTFTKDSAI